MRSYPLYMLDLDGTLYRGEEALPYAAETVAALRGRGAQIRFLTNNSGLTRGAYVEKLARLGFHPRPEEIYSSAIGAASWLNAQKLSSAFYVGEPGLAETLAEAGIRVVGADEQAAAVVAGICKGFTYQWLHQAMQQILGGARFVATNTDATYPVEGGKQIPGAGSLIAAIQTCGGKEPHVIGKPSPYLIDLVLGEAGVEAKDCLVVGDRVETDILSGQRAGCPTHLVLTGVAKEAPEGQPFSEDLRGLL